MLMYRGSFYNKHNILQYVLFSHRTTSILLPTYHRFQTPQGNGANHHAANVIH